MVYGNYWYKYNFFIFFDKKTEISNTKQRQVLRVLTMLTYVYINLSENVNGKTID